MSDMFVSLAQDAEDKGVEESLDAQGDEGGAENDQASVP